MAKDKAIEVMVRSSVASKRCVQWLERSWVLAHVSEN